MTYETHEFLQGSDAWHANRAKCYNASELASAAGESTNTTRNALINALATGAEREFSEWVLEHVINPGHRFEKLARPLAEEFIGEDLYPSVLSMSVPGLAKRLGASLDGKTMDDSTNWEHKRLNAELAAAMDQGMIPHKYHWQMEQGMMINGATRCLFTASDWDENDQLIDIKHLWYESNPELRAKIIPTWKQIEEDVAHYVPVEVIPAAVAAPTEGFGALVLQVEGRVVACNIDAFRAGAAAFLERLPKPEDLNSDQDFANADSAAKACAEAESKIKAAKDAGLAQMSEVETVFRVADQIIAEIAAARIALTKSVDARKVTIRNEIMQKGKDALAEHIATLNKRLGRVQMPAIAADFAGAIKGKRTVDSLRNAVDTELARAKIAANEIADKITINLATLDEHKDHAFLFNDIPSLAMKANDDLKNVIKLRISEHETEQQRKLDAERERIRKEEEAKAAQKVKDDAEKARLAAEVTAPVVQLVEKNAPQSGSGAPAPLRQPAPSLETVLRAVAPTAIVQAISPSLDYVALVSELMQKMDASQQIRVYQFAERLYESPERIANL